MRSQIQAREDLARRVLEAGHLVQVVVVELVVERLPGVVEALKVDEPAGLLVDRAGDGELDAEAVPVKARALVPGRDLRQAVRRLEAELVHEPDVHGKSGVPSG